MILYSIVEIAKVSTYDVLIKQTTTESGKEILCSFIKE